MAVWYGQFLFTYFIVAVLDSIEWEVLDSESFYHDGLLKSRVTGTRFSFFSFPLR